VGANDYQAVKDREAQASLEAARQQRAQGQQLRESFPGAPAI
jgi:hypothetical protein